MPWLNVSFLRMDRLLGQSCVLVEFFDSARINSHRTLPYTKGWHARYAESGLRVIGVHCPAYSFGRDHEVVERAVRALEIEHPVLLDPDFMVWRQYGNKGWPARYLFDRMGILRFFHYGEGDYAGTEHAIGEVLRELDPDLDLPDEPLEHPAERPGPAADSQAPERRLPA